MSKHIIDFPDGVEWGVVTCRTEDGFYTRDFDSLEELNSDYINENFGELQDEAYQRGYEDGKKSVSEPDRIEVGDEVISLRKNGEVIEDISPWIVTYETKYAYQGFDACGMFHNNPKESVRKTGKHYDIQSILEAMRT